MNPIRFTASTSWADAIADLDPKIRLEIYEAAFHYVKTGETPALSPVARAAFAFIKVDLLQEQIRRQRLSDTRAKAGHKGGTTKRAEKKTPPDSHEQGGA